MQRCEVREIAAEETVPVRWPVLRPGFPREAAQFPGDDLPATRHFGAFVEGRLLAVASIYATPMPEQPEVEKAWQLRGMAVLPEAQGAGHGRAVLHACELEARRAGGELLWCNARVTAAEFYRRQGYAILGEQFDIPTVGPHWRMWRRL